MSQLIPEQQLRNLAELVIEQTTPTRRNVGKRPDNYAYSKQDIADAARQLAEEVLRCLDAANSPDVYDMEQDWGPEPAGDDELPF